MALTKCGRLGWAGQVRREEVTLLNRVLNWATNAVWKTKISTVGPDRKRRGEIVEIKRRGNARSEEMAKNCWRDTETSNLFTMRFAVWCLQKINKHIGTSAFPETRILSTSNLSLVPTTLTFYSLTYRTVLMTSISSLLYSTVFTIFYYSNSFVQTYGKDFGYIPTVLYCEICSLLIHTITPWLLLAFVYLSFLLND